VVRGGRVPLHQLGVSPTTSRTVRAR
jgi:hypothetical protein